MPRCQLQVILSVIGYLVPQSLLSCCIANPEAGVNWSNARFQLQDTLNVNGHPVPLDFAEGHHDSDISNLETILADLTARYLKAAAILQKTASPEAGCCINFQSAAAASHKKQQFGGRSCLKAQRLDSTW